MNAQDQEKNFLEKVRDLLNDGVENLDGQTKKRLENIRTRALGAAGGGRRGFFTPPHWVMVGGFATATMAVAALFFWLHPSPGIFPTKHIEDFEIITSGEHIDFYQNLDFYRWLAARESIPARGEAS
jgi:hypothetical protein